MLFRLPLAAMGLIAGVGMALGAGLPLSIEQFDTSALPDVGDEWLSENPYRNQGEDVWLKAIEIGESGFTQNCARCHGLGAVSGGLAPDLRFLEAEEYGDEWFVERFRGGYSQGGITKMPAFGDILGQKAGWAIRTYIETRPDQDAIEEVTPRLREIRDLLKNMAEGGGGDASALQAELAQIADKIETLSGAPVADSIAFRAARILDSENPDFKDAAETLTIGLSAAH